MLALNARVDLILCILRNAGKNNLRGRLRFVGKIICAGVCLALPAGVSGIQVRWS